MIDPQLHTDDGRWTPQTQMLRSIQAWIGAAPAKFAPREALSIDVNESIDGMLLHRWPGLKVTRASYPKIDCQDLPMADDSFDLVYSNQVLEHIPKPWQAASEIIRVLRRGGLGIHTTCAFNPRHGPPHFEDFYRFMPSGLAQLFPGVKVHELAEWGNAEAIRHNVSVDDGFGKLGGRRFDESIGARSDGLYPWVVWIIFEK
jgi:ubiquinone/menaquinone biosynthesis C-methylase UbiE